MRALREMSGLEAALFDFDGTLVDASEAICRSFNAALARAGLGPSPEAEVRAMIGRPLREMFAAADPGAGPAELEAHVAAYREAWAPIAVPLSRMLPTVPEALGRLAGRLRLGVVTSRAGAGADLILHAFGLRQLFGTVVGVDRVVRPKPHAEPVLRALSELGVDPERAVMVGDTPDDVVAGRAAGARTVGVTTGVYGAPALAAAGADLVVDRLGELADRLLGLEPATGPARRAARGR